MKAFQDLQVLLGSQALQAVAYFPRENQAQWASLGYQAAREIGAFKGLLGLRATQALQDLKVREVLLVPEVLLDPKVRLGSLGLGAARD